MAHEHHHELHGKNLFFTVLLNLSITIAEVIGGVLSGSIALISDAVHNFSDVLSLIVTFIANRLVKRDASNQQTFGFKRAEIVAAFLNSATLIALALFILYEAFHRLFNPVEVAVNLVIWLALGSIVVNGLSVLFIKEDSHDNMNIKSAYLHLFGDMMTSIAVVAGGLLMKFFHITWIDPVLSMAIAVYLLYLSWDIFISSLKIIMQFTPHGIDVEKIASEIANFDGVENIHHLHIWQIDEHDIMFEAHLELSADVTITQFEKTLTEIKSFLHHTYHIHHVTLQPEFTLCNNKDLLH